MNINPIEDALSKHPYKKPCRGLMAWTEVNLLIIKKIVYRYGWLIATTKHQYLISTYLATKQQITMQ